MKHGGEGQQQREHMSVGWALPTRMACVLQRQSKEPLQALKPQAYTPTPRPGARTVSFSLPLRVGRDWPSFRSVDLAATLGTTWVVSRRFRVGRLAGDRAACRRKGRGGGKRGRGVG